MQRSSTWEFPIRSLISVVILGWCLAACGGGETGPTLAPDVDVIVDAAAETMGEIETVRFTLEADGESIYIDPAGTLAFRSAEGRYQAPTSADAVVVVSAGGFNAQVGAVAIDGELWITNPITGVWEPTPEGYSFDPAALFDPEIGFRPLLAELTDVTLVGTETRDGETRYHLTGTAGAERISTVTAGLVSNQDVMVDLWLDPVDGSLTEAEFATTSSGGTTEWRLTFLDYGADITVEIPDFRG